MFTDILFQKLVVNVAKTGSLGFSISVRKNCSQLVDRLHKILINLTVVTFHSIDSSFTLCMLFIAPIMAIEFFFAMTFADFTETEMASY